MTNHFEFDRVYCHDYSASQVGPTRCFNDGALYLSVHDSYIAGMNRGESQCIDSVSLGPTAFINNFCEAASQATLSGGSYPTYFPLTVSNKIFLHNFAYKPFAWKYMCRGASCGNGTSGLGTTPSGACLWDSLGIDSVHDGGEFYLNGDTNVGYACVSGTWTITAARPTEYTIKNIMEGKSLHNHLYSGNYLLNNWVNAQQGQAFIFGMAFDSGPGFANDHITVTNNIVKNTYQFLRGGGICSGVNTGLAPCLVMPSFHTIVNNLAITGGKPYCGVLFDTANTCGTSLYPGSFWDGSVTANDTFSKVTAIAPGGISGSPYFPLGWDIINEWPKPNDNLHANITFINSIIPYDVGGCTYFTAGTQCYNGVSGTTGLFRGTVPAFQSSLFSNVGIIGGSQDYSAGTTATNTVGTNAKPADIAAMGFVNASADDYHISGSSNFSAANGCITLCNSDGTDLGADIDMINMLTAGVLTGTPSWDVLYLTGIVPGSTTMQFNLVGTTNYTVKLYSAPARITANLVGTQTCTISAGACSTTFTGLTPSTQYYVSMTDGTVTLVFPRTGVTEVVTSLSGTGNISGQVRITGATKIH
jgi:hypothetical protein